MQPFNGDYYGTDGEVKNILGEAKENTGRPNDHKHPFNGNFYAGDGSIHNIDEFQDSLAFSSAGEWTPTVVFGDVSVTGVSVAEFVRIGKMVFAWARFSTTPNTMPNSNVVQIRIGGLPYPFNYHGTTTPPAPMLSNATNIVNWGVLAALPVNNQNYFALSFMAGNTINALNASNHRAQEVQHDLFIAYPTDAPVSDAISGTADKSQSSMSGNTETSDMSGDTDLNTEPNTVLNPDLETDLETDFTF